MMKAMRRRRARPAAAKSSVRENLESVLWAAALALVIRTLIIAPFKIPSGSMRPTLIEGDRILVSKFLYRFQAPRRGDIIVFRFPENPKRPFIKRLVAMGQEQIEIRNGRLLVNSRPSDAPILQQFYYHNQGEFGQLDTQVIVPEEMYYVLGDNSASSHDSRFWGFVPKRLLIGKAVCIFWPPRRIRILR